MSVWDKLGMYWIYWIFNGYGESVMGIVCL